MRIGRDITNPDTIRRLEPDIRAVIAGNRPDGRICGQACTVRCTHCGSTACHCMCAPDCPAAMRMLSDDPDNHPIEPAIMPLVFALRRLGLFRPCWSCEGHLAPDGSVWKPPRVWFYCHSLVHVRLLSQGLATLAIRRRLSQPWQVVVTYSDNDNPHTTFALEPAARGDASPCLNALRADTATIAHALPDLMRHEALSMHAAVIEATRHDGAVRTAEIR